MDDEKYGIKPESSAEESPNANHRGPNYQNRTEAEPAKQKERPF